MRSTKHGNVTGAAPLSSRYSAQALEWVLSNGAEHVAVETTKAGVVHGALSHLVGVRSKAAFACAAVRGFGSNLLPEKRASLAKEIYSWTAEVPADHRRPLDGHFCEQSGAPIAWLKPCDQQTGPPCYETHAPEHAPIAEQASRSSTYSVPIMCLLSTNYVPAMEQASRSSTSLTSGRSHSTSSPRTPGPWCTAPVYLQ